MTGIDSAEILAAVQSWAAIESPTSDAAAVNRMMDRAADEFSAIGALVERVPGCDGFGDHLKVRAPWGGDEPGLLVLCHLDTVHPVGSLGENPLRVEGDRAYGPGIYDMKGGAYLALTALAELIGAGRTTPLPIRMLLASDEEVGSPTSRELIEAEARRARAVIVPEPAREGGRIVTSRKGSIRMVISFTGRPAHAGRRHQDGRSAVREMAHQILALEALTDYARDITANVGVVRGGTTMNTVPEHAYLELDVRVPTLAAADEVMAKIEALEPHDPDVRITRSGGRSRPPFERNPGTLALLRHARGLAAEIGFALEDTHSGGGSDGNFTAPIAPTLDGLGVDGDGAHTGHEHLYISSLVPRTRLLLRLFETLDGSQASL